MSNLVGLTIIEDDNITGIKSFLGDETKKSLVVLDCTGSLDGPVARLLDVKNIEFDRIGMTEINNTGIIYVFLKKNNLHAKAKAYGINIIQKFISNVSFVLFFKPSHVYTEGAMKIYEDTLYAYPEIGACYSDFEIINSTQGVGRQYLFPFSYEHLVNNTFLKDNLAIKMETLSRFEIDQRLQILEDHELSLRVARQCIISHIPESLYSTDRSTFANVTEQQYKDDIEYIKSKLT